MNSGPLLDAYIGIIEHVGGIRTNFHRAFRLLLRRRELAPGARALPTLNGVARLLKVPKEAIREEHLRYTSTVSNWIFELSQEVCAFLDAYCRLVQPPRVLDLSPGFSSVVSGGTRSQTGGVSK